MPSSVRKAAHVLLLDHLGRIEDLPQNDAHMCVWISVREGNIVLQHIQHKLCADWHTECRALHARSQPDRRRQDRVDRGIRDHGCRVDWGCQVIELFVHALGLLLRAEVYDTHQDHDLAARGWRPGDRNTPRAPAGDFRLPIRIRRVELICRVDDLGDEFRNRREYEEPGPDVALFESAQHKFGDGAKVLARALQRPEEICIFLGVRLDDVTVCKDDSAFEQTIDRETVLPREPSVAATQDEATYPTVRKEDQQNVGMDRVVSRKPKERERRREK